MELIIPGVQVEDNTPVMDITGLTQNYKKVNGNKDMYCGGPKAVCSRGNTNATIAAVNGAALMVCGQRRAVNGYRVVSKADAPSILANDSITPWDIPATLEYQAMCFFITGGVTRAETGEILNIRWLTIEEKWQKIIEYIVLALKPVHTTAVIWIHYTQEAENAQV